MNKSDVKDAVKEAMDEYRSALHVEEKRHYDDHEFVTSVRNNSKHAKKVSWTLFITAVVGYVLTTLFSFPNG